MLKYFVFFKIIDHKVLSSCKQYKCKYLSKLSQILKCFVITWREEVRCSRLVASFSFPEFSKTFVEVLYKIIMCHLNSSVFDGWTFLFLKGFCVGKAMYRLCMCLYMYICNRCLTVTHFTVHKMLRTHSDLNGTNTVHCSMYDLSHCSTTYLLSHPLKPEGSRWVFCSQNSD
jgi:hypothetical protein